MVKTPTMSEQKLGLLVELDCLQDTRIATIARIDQMAAQTALSSGYHTRESDHFPWVDMKLFKELYAKRDRTTLAHSAPTNMLLVVRELLKLMVKNNEIANHPTRIHPISLSINTYPYELSKEEQEAILAVYSSRFGDICPVELVTYSPASLSPAFIRQNYATMVMYDPHTWLNLHYTADPATVDLQAFMKTLLHDVTLIAPAIYYQEAPSQQEIEEIQSELGKDANPLEVTLRLARSLVGLQLIDVSLFSVLSPERAA